MIHIILFAIRQIQAYSQSKTYCTNVNFLLIQLVQLFCLNSERQIRLNSHNQAQSLFNHISLRLTQLDHMLDFNLTERRYCKAAFISQENLKAQA